LGHTFEFQALATNILEQGIRVVEEGVFYNCIDNNTMTLSNFGKPFRVAKEMHPLALEALIGACSKLGSFVVDFATLTGM